MGPDKEEDLLSLDDEHLDDVTGGVAPYLAGMAVASLAVYGASQVGRFLYLRKARECRAEGKQVRLRSTGWACERE